MLKFEWPIVTGVFLFEGNQILRRLNLRWNLEKIHLPILLLRHRTADDLLQILYKFNLNLFSPK